MTAVRYVDRTSPQLDAAFKSGQVTVILPVGSIEQHGPHLPVGMDALMAEQLAAAAAARLGDAVLVLATLWYGYSPHHMSFPGTITLSAKTYLAVIAEIAGSLYEHGLKDLVILNGHGGNIAPLRTVIAEIARIHGRSPRVITYWELISQEIGKIFEHPELACGHACALETSLALHLFPATVHKDAIPAHRSGEAGPHMFGSRPVLEGLDFGKYSSNGVIGEPSLGTAAIGARLFELIVTGLVGVLKSHVRPDPAN
jgi:creatinine amidohydrolase